MYYCSHSRVYTLVLRCGLVVIALLVNDGDCKERKLSSEDSSSPSAMKSSFDHHTHSKWDLWPILSQDKKNPLPWDQHSQMPNIVPLTLQEQIQRQKKSQSKEKLKKSVNANTYDAKEEGSRAESNQEKKQKGKTAGDYSEDFLTTSPEDLAAIREKALNFGKLVLNFLAKQVLAPVEDLSENGPREARGFFSSPFRQPQERQEGGGGESEGNRNRVIDWVARLIGVQGKTLGEFLREYQVHVLYDLVFTFFKWIFFLYAGLLIP